MEDEPKLLAVLTSGGDAPGMNAALWSLTRAAQARHWRVLGVRRGFRGLLDHDTRVLDAEALLPWARHGGTVLQTARLTDFPSRVEDLRRALRDLAVEKLAVLGGNGSLAGCAHLAGAADVVGIPATIDGDVAGSDTTIGFDTALNTALVLLDGIRDTAEAMPRLFALRTLGGDTPFLADALARAGAADLLLVPETAPDDATIRTRIGAALERRAYAIIVASEGFRDLAGTLDRLCDALGVHYRLTSVGHAQRGGRPTARDRGLAVALGESAVEALAAGRSGRLCWRGDAPVLTPFGRHEAKAYPGGGDAP